jgi:AraC-like DNA-binding protein
VSASTSAGYVQLLCEVAEREYRLGRDELFLVEGVERAVRADPGETVPQSTFLELLRLTLRRTGDRALGLRLAHAFDLRKQGFFGYALLSASSVRERVAVHARYQRLRGLVAFTMCFEDDLLIAECSTQGLPPELAPIILDFGFAGACIHHRRRLTRADTKMQLWVSYREEPHHRALRALVGGPVVFEAPCNRLQMMAADLDLPLAGDEHLAKLATAQLEASLDASSDASPLAGERALLQRVRERLRSRLAHDVSLEALAADLGVSPRTLRRHLVAHGTSYQALLEEERLSLAASYLLDTDEDVGWIATQLGYGDPSNFRRAFRRWTGKAPSAYRAEARSTAGRLPLAVAR